MPALSAWLEANGLLRITLASWPSLQETSEFRQRLRRSGMLRDNLVVLADMRQLTSEGEPAWEEVHFSLKQIPIDIGGPRRYALLTKPELQPLARMIATVAPEHLQFEAFTDESAATAWLLRHAV